MLVMYTYILVLALLLFVSWSKKLTVPLVDIQPDGSIPLSIEVDLIGDFFSSINNFCMLHELSNPKCYEIQQHFAKKATEELEQRRPTCSRRNNPRLDGFQQGLIPSCRSNQMRIAIIHLSTGRAHWSSSHAQAINLFYARRHGYEFISHSCPTFSNQSFIWDERDQVRANWCKPLLLIEHLKKYHYVLMLDSDAYIMDPSYRIEQFVDEYMTEGFSLIVPRNCMAIGGSDLQNLECWPDIPGVAEVNIGAIVAKSSIEAIALLQRWYDSTADECKSLVYPNYVGKWAANDQQCLALLYQNHTEFSKGIRLLDPVQTYHFIGGSPTAWIKHWMYSGRMKSREVGLQIVDDLHTVADFKSYQDPLRHGPVSGVWKKYPNPVLSAEKLGVCFDISILGINGSTNSRDLMMYFSWRPLGSIAVTKLVDGHKWDENNPKIVLYGNIPADHSRAWESVVNRPYVLYHDGKYKMWYTGQMASTSMIGYAESVDGINWIRHYSPVLTPSYAWEKKSLMCSFVLYDSVSSEYRMWYSGGDQFEPDAIGHATSCDGINWTKSSEDPIFVANQAYEWEKDRVTCPSIVYNGEYYYMFYIGFENIDLASIGVARSKDGLTDWERLPKNPIIRPTPGSWDEEAVYKPFPIFSEGVWKIWYNGRRGSVEQIGLAELSGFDLGFTASEIYQTNTSLIKETRKEVLKIPVSLGASSSAYSTDLVAYEDEHPKTVVYNFCVRFNLLASDCDMLLKEASFQLQNSITKSDLEEMTDKIGSTDIGALLLSLEVLHRLTKASIVPGSPSFEGFLATQRRQVLLYLLSGHTEWVDSVCETGFNGGHSAMSLLFGSKKSKLISFDFFNKQFQYVAHQLLVNTFGSQRIKIVTGDTVSTLPTFIAKTENAGHRCNLIAIDGGHQYEVASSDILNFEKISACDNIVLMDDVYQKYADAWNAHHVDGAKFAWNDAVTSKKIKQYGCYEFFDNVPELYVDPGVWGGADHLPRSFCIGSFSIPHCPAEFSTKVEMRIKDILGTIGLISCDTGCCN